MNKAGAISNEAQDLIEDDRDEANIWNKGPELIDDDGEIRELTAKDFATFEPFSSLPPHLQHTLREINRGNVTFRPDPVEERVPVKLSRSVVDRFRATGANWETKVDQALRQWLDDHQAT